jgi:Flp pilus assembly protein TadG
MAFRRKARKGAEAVEFALVFPVLLIVTAGIIDWSWFYSNHLTMLHAMREGMRYGASIDSDSTAADDYTETMVQDQLTAMGWTNCSAPVSQLVLGSNDVCMVQTTLSCTATPLWGLVPSPDTMTATEQIRVEDQDHCDSL